MAPVILMESSAIPLDGIKVAGGERSLADEHTGLTGTAIVVSKQFLIVFPVNEQFATCAAAPVLHLRCVRVDVVAFQPFIKLFRTCQVVGLIFHQDADAVCEVKHGVFLLVFWPPECVCDTWRLFCGCLL